MPGPGGEADGAVGGARGQGRRAALGQDPAPVDDDHLVGQPLGLGQLVGGEDHADAPVALGGDDLADREAALGVDAGGGLVEEEHLGPADQGQGQRQALLLAAGQPPPRGPADRYRAPPGRGARRGPRGRRSSGRTGGGPGPSRASGRRRRAAASRRSGAPARRGPGRGRGRGPGPSRRRPAGSPRGPRRCWSCRRRWGRAAPPPDRPARRSSAGRRPRCGRSG